MAQATPEIVLLLANERSGTHLLRSLLQNTGQVAAPDELCNPEHGGKGSASFFEFRTACIAEHPHLVMPTAAHQDHLLTLYFDFLRERFKRRQCVVCDIKYAHIHNFNNLWWDLLNPPFLIQYAAQKRIPIIHLYRNKIYQTSFSDFYSHATGVWRAKSLEGVVTQPIEVNLAALKLKAERIGKNIKMVNRWLRHNRHTDVTYEQISGPDVLPALNRVLRFLGLDAVEQIKADFVKTTPAYNSVISNFAEIEPFLSMDLDMED